MISALLIEQGDLGCSSPNASHFILDVSYLRDCGRQGLVRASLWLSRSTIDREENVLRLSSVGIGGRGFVLSIDSEEC